MMHRGQFIAGSVVAATALIVCVSLWFPPGSPEAPVVGSTESSQAPGREVTKTTALKPQRVPAGPEPIDLGAKQEDPSSAGSSPLPLTVQQQVEEIILQMRNPGVPEKDVYRTLDQVDEVSKNPSFNPQGKTLTFAQRESLAELVNQQNDQFQNAGDVQRETHIDASLNALKSNQYVYIEMGTTAAENQKRVSKAKDSLTLRFGKELKDWRCNQSFRSSSEGDSWIVLVWYTAFQNPEPFDAADGLVKTLLNKDKSYREFFASMR
ncbi:hypothetical protein N8467_00175 [bacterium]|nr:hypothetical protein [bacterium]